MKDEIKKLTTLISEEMAFQLPKKWIGVYFHGSLRLGSFSWQHSDLDFILVVNECLQVYEKQQICDWMMAHRQLFPAKGFEFSVVLEKYCTNFVYPTPYELHMSKAYEHIYQCDPERVWHTEGKCDPDLASHFHVLHVPNDELDFGKRASEVFGPVDMNYVLHSNWLDVCQSEENIVKEPIDVILNLCRFYAMLTENKTLSKVDGGRWALDRACFQDQRLIMKAIDAYANKEEGEWRIQSLQSFACEALSLIRANKRLRCVETMIK